MPMSILFSFFLWTCFCQPSSCTFSISRSIVTELLKKNHEFSHRYFLCTVPKCLVWISNNSKLFLFILFSFLKTEDILIMLFFKEMCVAYWKNAGGDFIVPGVISGNEDSSWLLLMLVPLKCILRFLATPGECTRKCLPQCVVNIFDKIFRGLDMKCLVCIHVLTAL